MSRPARVRLTAAAPGKINLCLFLGPVRPDGRHQLVTLFESVSLADQLELTLAAAGADEVICASVEGPNLVSTALAALREHGWPAPPVRIEILKRVPVAAGMGGGSGDAAAALRLAAHLAPFPPEVDIPALAARLGADVPSQLLPGVVIGTGAGDKVTTVPPLAEHAVLILPLPWRLSTREVYAEADRLGLAREADELEGRLTALADALESAPELPGELLVNDLEPAALSLCPGIAEALAAARAGGAAQALVCGSGPTVAGLYRGPDALARARADAARLAARFPGASAVMPVSADFAAVAEPP